MPDKVYNVKTNLSPDELTIVAAETYRLWLSFALGGQEIGGKTLNHPSGRYAAAISWKRTGVSSVAIIADETKAPEAAYIEEGHKAFDIRQTMLASVEPDKYGNRSRVIPIRQEGQVPSIAGLGADIIGGAGGEGLPGNIAKLWGARSGSSPDHFVTMSDRYPEDWQIPAMPAYAPASILAKLLRKEVGR